jgi:hypothetical protein
LCFYVNPCKHRTLPVFHLSRGRAGEWPAKVGFEKKMKVLRDLEVWTSIEVMGGIIRNSFLEKNNEYQ